MFESPFEPVPATPVTATEVTVHRQPVVRPDRSVHGYAVNVLVRAPLTRAQHGDELDALVHAEYEKLDLDALGGGSVVFVRATTAMLNSDWPLPETPGGLVLEVPPHFAELPDAAEHLIRLRASGIALALADYVPGGAQDVLLELVDFAKVDLGRGVDVAAYAVAHAHRRDVVVIAERVDREAAVRFCATHEVELLQGPLFQRDATPTAREFNAGEIQCLELMQLLSAADVDPDRVVRVVSSDPELAIRVLRLVNSSAIGIRRRIDSVRQAVILLGPQPLAALAMAALGDAGSHTVAGLWFVLTRAVACRSIAGEDAAYTVGLLSAVAAQLQIAPADLVARTGVSADVGDALLTMTGPYGHVLAAVLAHEENDIAAVEATGLESFDVAHAYLAAIADALGTATSLAGQPAGAH
ncbi:EAL and HDOD domain-containing protein [Pengzhenrongella sp.]|uniref:EAL and HDOD domain-containing protein n=1 Tax=Pengzhenrongella sp. TaxID=2888820 RepID=UPI002F93FCDF